MAALRIWTLGHFAVALPGDATAMAPSPAYSQGRLLLKCLLAAPGYQRTRDETIELLWPEQSVARGRASLSHALSQLRRLCEPTRSAYDDSRHIGSNRELVWLVTAGPDGIVIQGDGAGYPNLWIDAVVFEESARAALAQLEPSNAGTAFDDGLALAQRALALYKGQFLPADPYREWAQPARDRAQRLWAALVRRVASVQAASGDLERALLLLGQLADAFPDNEDAAMRLMLAYAAARQRSEALRVYQQLSARLANTLGITPADDLRTLAHGIRSGELAEHPLTLLQRLS